MSSSQNFIDFEVLNEQVGRWRYTGFYGFPERSRRADSWNLIRDLAQLSNLPWCIAGDFNDIARSDEKRGGRQHPRHLLEGFNQALADCGLADLGFVGEKFTWERCRGGDSWIQERLDRGLATNEWKELFPEAEVRIVEVSTSDHLPLCITLNRKIYMPRERRFRFENAWIKESECRSIIQECWHADQGAGIVDKMVRCCAKLEEWGGGLLKEMRAHMESYRRELRKYRSRRDLEGIMKYNKARWEYMRLLEKQEIYWKQRAKQFWLKEGDKNSRFFHKYASTRRERNSLMGIKDVNGLWKETDMEVREVITSYFTGLFQAGVNNGGLTDREHLNTVSEEQNTALMEPVSEDEVKLAVFAMYPDKSPGMDGLNPAFFQTYWDIVKNDVTGLCSLFLTTGALPEGLNRTLVCLIPKVKKPTQMSELRPISLCNVLMRILSKVMTNRLKPCLNGIISSSQSAFIEGRLLTDNALIAFEINHYIHRKTQGNSGVAAVKLDISKAYDRLEWFFLEHMLHKFGFHPIWINRVMACVTTVSYSFLHNGEVFGEVQPQRGVRQGDPISPYLYLLCAEGLSAIIRRNEACNLIRGCKIARGAPSISHLLFADDCYLFMRALKPEAEVMRMILNRYESLSGQAINYAKSNVVFSPNTRTEDRTVVCDALGVGEVCKPEKYLGMPMFVGRNKGAIFGFLTDRIRQKLQGWENRELSKSGKLTLLKAAAQTIPNFWMSLFLIPASITDTMEKLMNGFFWGRGLQGKGIRWQAWDRLCTPKAGGGLGVKDLKKFNTAMLAKQGWRIMNNINPLVTSIMRARYFPNSNFLNAGLGVNPSYIWRSLLSAQATLKEGCRVKIGRGENTAVWGDQWLPDPVNGWMTTAMPVQLKHITVAGFMNAEGTHWDEEVIRDICNERDAELIQRIPLPSTPTCDSWVWLKDDKGVYTVKSCYRWLQGELNTNHIAFWKKLWSLQIPGKVADFLWRVCSGCLPTTTALAQRHVEISILCPWCHCAYEDDYHVLFGCGFAQSVWKMSNVLNHVQFDPGDTAFMVFHRCLSTCTREQCVLIAMISWSIWNRRNKWVWERVNGSAFGVLAAAHNLLNDWKEAQVANMVRNTGNLDRSLKKWRKPPDGWVTINCDASGVLNGSIGIGCVIRDSQGSFIGARCRRIQGQWQIREAEAISLREAISWVKLHGFQCCRFETDSQVLVRAINGQSGESYFHTIVSQCIHDLKHIDKVLVDFIYRSANGVAHLLASAAHSMSGCEEWFVTPPEFINDVLDLDLL